MDALAVTGRPRLCWTAHHAAARPRQQRYKEARTYVCTYKGHRPDVIASMHVYVYK